MNDEKIWLETEDGQKLFIIKSERIDMQEELNKANMQLMAQLEDYKSRCEKAVEYLKNNCYIGDCINTYEAIDITNVMDILNGRSDE